MSVPVWKDLLALHDRKAPELFERGDPIIGSPYAEEIRKAMEELSIAAMFCIQGVPQIAILEQAQYDSQTVLQVHAALWNQGLASMLVVSAEDTVRVFSLAKTPGAGDPEQFEKRCLIEAIEATALALSLKDYVYGAESGRLWHEKSEYFDPKERIDAVLLNNLTVAHDLLSRQGLSPDEAQAILIQTMFIAYLEDRGITTSDFFESVSNGQYQSLSNIYLNGDLAVLNRLFSQLQRDFNGDLFVAPCSFDNADHPKRLNSEAMTILHRFREGREEMSETSGQMRFWGYNFKFIPVELISAVYDRFLGHDQDARSAAGAYYTPMFLVDTVISLVWETIDERTKERGTFFDPSCGSGIFLVRAFQRLCEHWRQNAKMDTIRWDSLLKMLSRVHGRDLNGGAVRVAVFSLYIALLEEVSPPDIRKLASKGRLLPPLWNKTLVQGDFFEEDPADIQADVIIGNPPWASRRNRNSSGASWCKNNQFPMPSGQEAWAFTWKARAHLTTHGVVAFLLPTMGFLHNHASNSLKARVRLFEESRIERVVNLSDLRRQLFDSAIDATALILFRNIDPEFRASDYKFEYWTPKADLNLTIKRFIALSKADKSMLRLSDVRTNPLVFKQRLWMRSPDAKLFNYLNALPKLSSFVSQYGDLKKRKEDTSVGWVIGQGFQPFHGANATTNDSNRFESAIVSTIPHLPVVAYTSISVGARDLSPWSSSIVRRLGFERGFTGPRILVPQGVATSVTRLRASFTDEALTFQDSLQAIVAPLAEAEKAKFVTAVLNSRLAVWFAFQATSSFGSSRPKVHQVELLKLPMPEPGDVTSPSGARSARKKLVRVIDKHISERDDLLRPPQADDELLRQIDRLTYEYFGLTDEEITLIEDAVEYILPAAQPNAGTFPEIWKLANSIERQAYANQLISSLADWFDQERKLSVSLIGANEDFGILRLKLTAGTKPKTPAYSEEPDASFSKALRTIADAIKRPLAQNFQTLPDLKIFVGDSLYLVKPMQRRFWLKSSALVDADSIASDLETTLSVGTARSAAS